MFIKSDHIYFRALEASDLPLLYECENNRSVWQVSNTQTPFSKYVLEQYLASSHLDIYTNKQLRLLICLNTTDEPIGTIDLFDFEPFHARVGVGILIFEQYRQLGYAVESVNLLKLYAFDTLMVHQVFCNISVSNEVSRLVFEKCNFEKAGVKKQWNRIAEHTFEDEFIYQVFNPSSSFF